MYERPMCSPVCEFSRLLYGFIQLFCRVVGMLLFRFGSVVQSSLLRMWSLRRNRKDSQYSVWSKENCEKNWRRL